MEAEITETNCLFFDEKFDNYKNNVYNKAIKERSDFYENKNNRKRVKNNRSIK